MMRRLVILVVLAATVAVPVALAAAGDETARVAVLADASKAVVCIFATADAPGGGSGVVIHPDGYGLTNYHVVADFLDVRHGVGGLADGKLYYLEVLGIDPGGDVALFKLHGKERFDFAPLGDSDALAVGQTVAALGNPFILAEDFTPTITLGPITGLHRYQEGQGQLNNLLEYADCIQVATSINPGNSGGPLFDLSGGVIGINGRASFKAEDMASRGRVNVGLGYAISINQIKRFLPDLFAGNLCRHGTLGATVRRAGERLIVDAIQDFGPADAAGVKLGDELLALDGRPVTTANDVNNLLATLPAGWPLELTLLRDEQIVRAAAVLEPLPLEGIDFRPDLAIAQREGRRLLAAAALDTLAGAVEIALPGKTTAEPTTLAVTSESFTIGAGTEVQQLSPPTSGPFAWDALAAAGTDWSLSDPRVADVFRALAAPVGDPAARSSGDIRLVGAARRGEAICYAIEDRPLSGARRRWLLDLDTLAVHEMAIVAADGTPLVVVARPSPIEHGAAPLAPRIDIPTSWRAVAESVVKLSGAGIGRVEGYGCGVIVDPDGQILTTESTLLESPELAATLFDGRRLPARVVRRDEQRQLALLEIEAQNLPALVPAVDVVLVTGAPLLVAANPFEVADGAEPVTLIPTWLAGVTRLDARRRAQDFPYTGDALLLDAVVATPGSAGGAVVDEAGRLVGLVGKAVVSKQTNTWTNYALPADELRDFLSAPASPTPTLSPTAARLAGLRGDLGLRLMDYGSRNPPAYVERVRPGSPARAAGIQPDDLILAVDGRNIATCAEYAAAIARVAPGQTVELVYKRGATIHTATLIAVAPPGGSR